MRAAAQESVMLPKLTGFARRIDVALNLPINVNSQGAIKMAENNLSVNKTKHLVIRYHFVQELAKEKKVTLFYCPSTETVADISTKPATSIKFQNLWRPRDWVIERNAWALSKTGRVAKVLLNSGIKLNWNSRTVKKSPKWKFLG